MKFKCQSVDGSISVAIRTLRWQNENVYEYEQNMYSGELFEELNQSLKVGDEDSLL